MFNFDVLEEMTIGEEERLAVEYQQDMQAEQDSVADLSEELAVIEVATMQVADLLDNTHALDNMLKYISDAGCDEELVTALSPAFEDCGITLEIGEDQFVSAAIEELKDKGMLDKIKEVLTRILDAIVRIAQKFNDQNKKDYNTLEATLKEKLSDIGNIDPEKSADVLVTALSPADIDTITKTFSSHNLDTDIKSGDLSKAVPKNILDALSVFGHIIDKDNKIVRDPKFTIERKKMSDIGWSPSEVRKAAESTMQMLRYIRRGHRRMLKRTRSDISTTSEEEAKALKLKLVNVMSMIIAIERMSLVTSKMVIDLIKVLKEKQ